MVLNLRTQDSGLNTQHSALRTEDSALGTWYSALQPHDVVPAIDVQHLAGDAARHRRDEKEGGVGDLLQFDVATERGSLGVVVEHRRKTFDAAGGEGVQRAGGDGVHANVLRA